MQIPMIALNEVSILPYMLLHFDAKNPKSKKAIEIAMKKDQKIFVIAKHPDVQNEEKTSKLFSIGMIVDIKQIIKIKKEEIRVIVQGNTKAILESVDETKASLFADVQPLEQVRYEIDNKNLEEAKIRILKEVFLEYIDLNHLVRRDAGRQIEPIKEINELLDYVSSNLLFPYLEIQKLLEILDNEILYDEILSKLSNEVEVLKIKVTIAEEAGEAIDDNQRKYVLREHMKVLKKALGEEEVSDVDEFQQKLDKLDAPDKVKDKIKKEITRFKSTSSQSSEHSMLYTYIETMLEIPWNLKTKDNKNIKRAKKVLDTEHFGLEEVKERILDYLAVRIMNDDLGDTPILCLVGPPGTGKTSIAKSLANALQKKYARISLGGVHDEAEIRGHRKTYVGAMPGRIATALKSVGVKNPLILLDEIDKVSRDHRGDTFSALLEVLDSEQNTKFRDHYLETSLDLSEVLFLATANSLDTIPRPLLDRMEVIQITSYTENEKIHIAQKHLIPKQLKINGLTRKQLLISKTAIEKLCRHYTKESGVRQLERRIAELCRKSARELLESDIDKIQITGTNINKYLGKEKYTFKLKNDINEIGIVRGLAWTRVGGDTLQIEVNVMRGKGSVMLTGKLGDVMKESAQTGISYIRSIGEEYAIDEEFFAKHDIHIHIPEGAVPKDGPSAGITMATAILSAVTNTPVYADVAMTGEITLRGRVLPIGGLKEKLLAAKVARMKTVIIPKENERDLADISEEITTGMTIVPVDSMSQVCEIALVK